MTCGCDTPPSTIDPRVVSDNAVMCLVCRHRRGETCFGEVMTVDGKRARGALRVPVEVRIERSVCPRGHHADERGARRWLGVAWYGVPMPIRWALFDDDVRGWLGLGPKRLPMDMVVRAAGGVGAVDGGGRTPRRVWFGAWAGCGCCVWLKARWARLVDALRPLGRAIMVVLGRNNVP